MFVVTLRKGGMKRVALVCACTALLVAGALGINALRFRGDESAATAAATLGGQLAGAQDLLTFLRGYGLEGDAATATVNTVTVPRKWDESFKAFHAVVEQSGLTLKKCKGKDVDKWMVLIPAQCTDEVKTYAVVLAYKNEAKAAYLLQKPSGEVLPLLPAAQTGVALPLTDEELAANATFGEGVAPDAEADDAALQAAAEASAYAGEAPTE